ncbi:MAG: L,D-transpeptidase [Verrucomicrobiales bacterium]
MRLVVLLALVPFLMVASCTTLSKSAGSKDGPKEMPSTARPEDVAQVDAFFANGGKHGFHPPAEKTPDLNATDTQFVVELDQQRVYLYHQGELIAASRISSGRRGYRTETGKYTIGQKNLNHRSNLYGSYVTTGGRTVAGDVKAGYDPQPAGARFVGSLMKYFQRFERNGSPTAMGFHQGVVPNYPASHGCIRLPASMAAWFYANVDKGTPIQINGAKNGVKPGTRQSGGRRPPRKFIPAAKPGDSAPAAGTTAAEAEGATATPPAEPTTPAPTEETTTPDAPEPASPSAPTPAPAEPAAPPAAPPVGDAAPPPAGG